MLKINKLALENFKFHHILPIGFNNDNCLIYGENGSGKSSIYWALYVVFYHSRDPKLSQSGFIEEHFKHQDYLAKNLSVKIGFNNAVNIDLVNETLNDNTNLLDHGNNIYCANQNIFNFIIEESDFYTVVSSELNIHFPKLKELLQIYSRLEYVFRNVIRKNGRYSRYATKLITIKRYLDDQFKQKFNSLINVDMVNEIIQNHFQENLIVNFEINDSILLPDNFIEPLIHLKINGNTKIKYHYNEAKLKLVGLAIYFTLIKQHEEKGSSVNLLILDDFLSSLDMGNRKFILQYILDEFNNYQKIILTHNLQFYNLAKDLLHINLLKKWDYKVIYSRFIGNISEAVIYDENNDYIKKAEEAYNKTPRDLEHCGNELRKEFEHILHEFEMLFQIGKKEELNKILTIIKNTQVSNPIAVYPEANHLITEIKTKLNNANKQIKSLIDSYPEQISYSEFHKLCLKKELFSLQKKKYTHSDIGKSIKDPVLRSILFVEVTLNKIIEDINSKEITTDELVAVLLKTEFYKRIFMNTTSHANPSKEIYPKEYEGAKQLLIHLKKLFVEFKKSS